MTTKIQNYNEDVENISKLQSIPWGLQWHIKEVKGRVNGLIDSNIYQNRTTLTTTEEKKDSQLELQKSDFFNQIKVVLNSIYEQYDNPKDRNNAILERLNNLFNYLDKGIFSENEIEKVKNGINSCLFIDDKKQYIETIMKFLIPLVILKEKHADEFEYALAKQTNNKYNFIEINRLLSYGKNKSVIHLHASAGKTVPNKIGLYRNGLIELAKIINDDPEIKTITASSYLVSEHQGLFIKLGFKISDINDDFKQKYFPWETRDIKEASINREDFLCRYFKNK